MKFEFYVLNYNCNKKCVEYYNIFNAYGIQEGCEKAIRKYLRAPKKYKHIKEYGSFINNTPPIYSYDFEALCDEFKIIFKHMFLARREWEQSISDAFIYEISDIVKELDKYETLDALKEELIKQNKRNAKLEKWDVYQQIEPNIYIIVNECIRQYKQQLKDKKSDK